MKISSLSVCAMNRIWTALKTWGKNSGTIRRDKGLPQTIWQQQRNMKMTCYIKTNNLFETKIDETVTFEKLVS